MDFEWEIAYINLDDLQLVLRLTHGTKRMIPMIIFDTGQMHDWKVGDRIDSNPGTMSQHRQMQKDMGMKMSEEDYTLTNQRTEGAALIRKNDYECEDAFVWMKELQDKGLI
jgi:hypothetical protein